MLRLQAEGFASGFYRKPRIDSQLLGRHSSGLIVLSGCAGSALSTRLRLGQTAEADLLMDFYTQTFRGNFFVELMYHGIPFETPLNRDLVQIAARHGVPTVATNDSHYCAPEDAKVHAALLCVQSQSTLAKPAFTFSGSGYHIASREEMERKPLPVSALDQSVMIADRIESYDEVFEERTRFPVYRKLRDGWTSEETLWELSREGLYERKYVTDRDLDQLRYEVDVICNAGYPDYFLVMSDVMAVGRGEGIVFGPGRGSAGGSLVAYSLRITDLDPIEHHLVFERFLNPYRRSKPDIDVDINDAQRPRFLQIVRELYGDDFFAQIGTFGMVGAKNALRDANRVLGGTNERGLWYSSQLPAPKFGRQPGLEEYTGPQDEVYQTAGGLYGTIRAEGVHAAAVVISPESLRDLVPLRRPGGKDGPWVIGLDMHEVESLGLVKLDFLGLRNLGIIDDTLRMLRPSRPELPTLPQECNDNATYELLSSGATLGVFQLDGPGMRGLLRQLRPSRFDDISAVLALYRPGPMGANAHTEYARRKASGADWRASWAIHPDLEASLAPILGESYGLIVWQEQVLEVLRVVCGWSYSEAALLFDAMRKKNHGKMAETKPAYEAAGRAKGFSAESLEGLWEVLVPFADYSFNRAHSAGYGLVAYWTAYLKANHPREYMASLLSSVSDEPEKLAEYLAEVRRMGIPLLPPDVNTSRVGFTPGEGGIHYGISAIRGVGEAVYGALSARRPYLNLDDFFRRAPAKVLNSGALAALTASGAMDSLTDLREELYVARDALAARALAHRQEAARGQRPLYRVTYGVGQSGLYNLTQRQEWERLYLSTVLSHGVVELVPKRPLNETELVWLRDLIERNPGDTRLRMRIGGININLPFANWQAIEQAVSSLGAFE